MMCRTMLEGSLSDIVSAYQKFAEYQCKILAPTLKVRANEKGSNLFKEICGKGSPGILSGGFDQGVKSSDAVFNFHKPAVLLIN